MRFFRKLISIILVAIMVLIPICNKPGQPVEDDPQYVVFMLTNVHYKNIEPYLVEMIKLHGEIDPSSKRMYAFGVVGPMCLTQSIEEMNEHVNHAFMLAEKYNIPVYFQMDDCTNYTDYFGYGATIDEYGNKFFNDPEMCEWIAFPEEGEQWGGQSYGRLPRWYCDWSGVPFAVAGGFPCYNSEKYLNWYSKQVKEGLIKPLMENYNKLREQGKDYLFAGLNTGWETQIPDFSVHNHAIMEDFECAQFGMHALHNLGYNQEKLEREAKIKSMEVEELTKELLYGVIADYIEYTCKMFYDAGIEKHKIISHTVSLSSFTEEYSTTRPPVWVSINDYCTPGWTMSPKTCPYDKDTLYRYLVKNGRNEYANAEGYAHYDDVETCREYFEETLLANAKLITVYGYDQGNGTYGYPKDENFYFVQVVREWLSYELGPDYKWTERPNMSILYGGPEWFVDLKLKIRDIFE